MKKWALVIGAMTGVLTAISILYSVREPIVIKHSFEDQHSGALFTVQNRTSDLMLVDVEPRIQIDCGAGWTNAVLDLYQPLSGLCVQSHGIFGKGVKTYAVNLPSGNYAWRIQLSGTIMPLPHWWSRFYDKAVDIFGKPHREDVLFSAFSDVRRHDAAPR